MKRKWKIALAGLMGLIVVITVLEVVLWQVRRGNSEKNPQDTEVAAMDKDADLQEDTESKKAAETNEDTAKKGNADQDASSQKGDMTKGSDSGKVPSKESASTGSGDKAQTAAGPLSVSGTKLVDSQGNPVQLKGISTHGLAWYPDYVNRECFAQLKEEWGADLIRLAMYTAEYGGYCTGGDKDSLKELVRNGVQYAAECGMYVIIDWHILSDGNPNTYIEEAKAFFREISQEYADYTNVFYEICNEPNGGTSWKEVKSYAEQIIEVIRENDEDGIILVGTPNWCQYVDQAAADPLENCENVMYTLHFYADTHRDSLRNTMIAALDAGLPIFVSEYGICDASGNGAINKDQANRWVSVMDQYGISYVAWNLSNKGETSAIFKTSCSKVNSFAAEDLSDSGKWLYEMLAGSGSENAGSQWVGAGTGTSGTGSAGVGTSGTGTSGTGTAGDNTAQGGNPAAGGNTAQGSNNSGGATGNVPRDNEERILTTADGLMVSASVVNSWEQDGKSCFQYMLTVSNPTDTDCTGWSVHLDFNGEITLNSGWNGNYLVEGNRLTITSMDYNGKITVGGSVDDVGFILQGEKGLAFTE